jgi:uncharacterized protein (DUF2147 family)
VILVRKLLVACAAGVAALSSVSAGVADAASPIQASGVWRNPKNSVHVRMQPCGNTVCGVVVWANARAQQKAREAGTPRLVGTQLFREFRQIGPGEWSGRVFVPDMNKTFSGSMKAEGPNAITGRGCLFGRFLCKSQTWTRVS